MDVDPILSVHFTKRAANKARKRSPWTAFRRKVRIGPFTAWIVVELQGVTNPEVSSVS